MRPEPVTIDLNGCARCHGEGHPNLTFEPLDYPVVLDGLPKATHWAACPTSGQPIMLAFVDKTVICER